MKVAYYGAFENISGYADAARNNVAAMLQSGVAVEACPLSFEEFKTDCGELGRMISKSICRKPTAKIKIIHTIPSVFDRFISLDKYNIGYTTWETDILPENRVHNINRLNEVWVPSEYNKEVFKCSGVNIPIFVMPHTFNIDIFNKESSGNIFTTTGKPNSFIFYSIFQFLERKGPIPLLKAYLTEFNADEDVCLLLKTYLFNPNNQGEKEKLKDCIRIIKDKLKLSEYPNLFLISGALSRPQINSIHKQCDCLVSSHCSEGYGVTLCESMMAGNPVIATDYSGSKDFLSENTGYPVDYQLTPVYNMPFGEYNGKHTWADIDIMDLRKKMRHVFNNRKEAKVKGIRGQNFIRENLAWNIVGKKMKERLETIHQNIS